MALKATIFKAEIGITDLDRHHYADYSLTIARHPSENDARMMVRLLAFALNAIETLQFCKGVSSEDEPDLWEKSYSDEIDLWIDLGHPDEKRIRKACGRSRKVIIYIYQRNAGLVWWEQIKNRLSRFDNLSICSIDDQAVASLAAFSQRTMRLQCTIQDHAVFISDGEQALEITPETWLAARA